MPERGDEDSASGAGGATLGPGGLPQDVPGDARSRTCARGPVVANALERSPAGWAPPADDRLRVVTTPGVEEADLLDPVVVVGQQPQHGRRTVLRVPRWAEQLTFEDGEAVARSDLGQPLTDPGAQIGVRDAGQRLRSARSLPLWPDQVYAGHRRRGQSGAEPASFCRGEQILSLLSICVAKADPVARR